MDPGSACVTCPKNKPAMENGRKDWMEKRDIKQHFKVLQNFS